MFCTPFPIYLRGMDFTLKTLICQGFVRFENLEKYSVRDWIASCAHNDESLLPVTTIKLAVAIMCERGIKYVIV